MTQCTNEPPVRLAGDELHDLAELLLDDFVRFSCLALLEGLADTQDHGEPRVKRGAGLLRDEGGGLVEEGASLGVAEDDERDASFAELGGPVREREREG